MRVCPPMRQPTDSHTFSPISTTWPMLLRLPITEPRPMRVLLRMPRTTTAPAPISTFSLMMTLAK